MVLVVVLAVLRLLVPEDVHVAERHSFEDDSFWNFGLACLISGDAACSPDSCVIAFSPGSRTFV